MNAPSRGLLFPTEKASVLDISRRDSDVFFHAGKSPARLTLEAADRCEQWLTSNPLHGAAYNSAESAANAVVAAHTAGKPVVVTMGAHVVKFMMGVLLGDLVRSGVVTHVAGNGATLIHEYEAAFHGETSESVERYIRDGRFGLWSSMEQMNDRIRDAEAAGLGPAFLDVLDRAKLDREVGPAKWADCTIANACLETRSGYTIHSQFGADINHIHGNFDAADWGERTHRDFRQLAGAVDRIGDGGVYINLGSSTTGPETFQKSLTLSRNCGNKADNFHTVVFDMAPLPSGWRDRSPDKSDSLYYFRPWKTLLDRVVATDREYAHYIRGDLRGTFFAFWRYVRRRLNAQT